MHVKCFQLIRTKQHRDECIFSLMKIHFTVKDILNLRVGLVGTGFCGSRLLCLPPFVLVHQFGQVGRLLRMTDDQLMLQQLFGSWSL